MRVHEAIVKALETIGVDAVFGGAGENSAGMMLALHDSGTIRPVIAKNEQGAAFMACGYAMFTEKLGVCFATAGPGAFNLISGLSVALTDSYPLLAITGYATVAWEDRPALNVTSGLRRSPDSRKIFDAVCKKDPATGRPASWLVTEIDEILPTLQKAVAIAYEGRPGPVHIAIGEELADPRVQVTNFQPLTVAPAPVVPPADQVAAAAALIAAAMAHDDGIVVLAGWGAIRSGAYAEVRSFIERFQLPLLTTMDGKGIVPEDHPLAIGLFCDSGHKAAWELFDRAKLVIAIGNSFAQHATFDFRDDLFHGRKLVHINIDPSDIDRVYRANCAVVGDAKRAVAALQAALEPLVGPVAAGSFRAPDYDAQFIIEPTPDLHPGRVIQAISQRLPERGVVLADAGAHAAWAAYYLELKAGQNFRKPGTYGPMGIATNGALGVKFGQMDRPVVAVVGDGCYLMAGFELMTAVAHAIPVIWVIFDDREFKLIKLYQLSAFHRAGLVEFPNPDFAEYARACGADGYSVDTIEEFEMAFEAALKSGRPTVIDAHITRLALPHYSPNPEGVLAALWEGTRKRFGL